MGAVEKVSYKAYTGTGVSGLELEFGQEFVCIDIRRTNYKYHAWKYGKNGAVGYEEFVTGTPNTIEWDAITPDTSIEIDGTKATINSTHVALNESGKDYVAVITPKN